MISRSTKSTRRRAAFARRSTRRPTSSSARPSIRRSTASCASRWWRPASIRSRSRRSSPATSSQGRSLHAPAPLRAAPFGPRRRLRSRRPSRGARRSMTRDASRPLRRRFPEPIEAATKRTRMATPQFIPPAPEQPTACAPAHAADRGSAAGGSEPAARHARGARRRPCAGDAPPVAIGETGRIRHHAPRGGARAPEAARRVAAGRRSQRRSASSSHADGWPGSATAPAAGAPAQARSTPTAGAFPALRSRRTTTSISRRFCGASRTDSWLGRTLRPRPLAAA